MKTKLILTGALVAALCLVALVRREHRAAALKISSAAKSPGRPPALLSARGERAIHRNIERRYAVTLKTTMTSSANTTPTPTRELAAIWQFRALDDEAAMPLLGQITDVTLTGFGGPVEMTKALASELARPHVLVLASDGHARSVRHSPQASRPAVETLKALLAAFQLVTADEATWQTEEEDPVGTYAASYRREGGAVLRKKERYLRVAGAAHQGLVVDSSGTRFELDDQHWPKRIETRETLRSQGPGPQYGLTMEVTVEALPVTKPLGIADSEAASLVSESLAMAPPAPDGRPVRSAEELMAELATAPDAAARTALAGRLEAGLRADPALAGRLGEALRAKPSGPLAAVVARSLGAAGTPEAEKELRELGTGKELPAEVRQEAFLGMGQLPEASPLTVDAMWTEVAKPSDPATRAAAAFALGAAAAREGREGDPALADRLIAAATKARDPDEKALWLQAIGGTGDPRAVDTLAAAVHSANAQERGIAAAALGGIDDPRAAALVGGALQDSHAFVRRQAARAATAGSLQAVLPLLGQRLKEEPDREVRRIILEAMQREPSPAARALLAWAQSHDPDPALRQMADQTLGR